MLLVPEGCFTEPTRCTGSACIVKSFTTRSACAGLMVLIGSTVKWTRMRTHIFRTVDSPSRTSSFIGSARVITMP
jgi:hypothetical protein